LDRRDRNDVLFADTEQLGIYRYRVGGRNEKELDSLVRGFAVNLTDINESNIEPRPAIRIGSERIAAGAERFQTREIWKWILLVALVLLVAEWLIYHRRIAV
jgi:type VI protein secretion system component VasF